ncbi:MAG TPA: GNAT family N-acetyltransferase [Myxococcaceae bacterium]|nr:GNAT family N-acetyltransferase [Myxococcaceae bacterium]
MNVTLRPAVEGDFEACRRTYFAEMDWINERLQLKRDDQERMFREMWAPAQVCIIQADGVDVGWLQTVASKSDEFLGQMFVDAPFQNRGIGTEVLRGVIDEASRRNLPVRLAVVKFNPARRLYERLGFRVTREDERKVYMSREPGLNEGRRD